MPQPRSQQSTHVLIKRQVIAQRGRKNLDNVTERKWKSMWARQLTSRKGWVPIRIKMRLRITEECIPHVLHT